MRSSESKRKRFCPSFLVYSTDMFRRFLFLIVAMSGSFLAILDMTIVAMAIPEMVEELKTDILTIRWVLQGYQISFAVFTLTVYSLVSRFGTKKAFVGALSGFTASSLLCAMAPSAYWLNFFRLIQGALGGVMVPTAFTIVAEAFPPQERGRGFGAFGLVIITAPALGPILGGALIQHFSFRSIFLANLPIGSAAVLLAIHALPSSREKNTPFDFSGFFMLAVSLSGLLMAASEVQLQGFRSLAVMAGLSAFLLFGLAFLRHAKEHPSPVIPVDLLAQPSFCRLMLLNAGRAFTLFSRIFLLPILLQQGFKLSPLVAGMLIAPGPILSGLSMPFFGALSDRYGPYPFLKGSVVLMVIANVMFACEKLSNNLSFVLISIALYGLALGMMNPALTSSSMNVVKPQLISAVSTYITIIMNTVGALAVALVSNLFAFSQMHWMPHLPLSSRIRQSAAICFVLLGFVMAITALALAPLKPSLERNG